MKNEVKHFKKEQFPLIASWWREHGLQPPRLSMMPEDSTFVLFVDDMPAASLSVFLTNTPMGWVDNLIANPKVRASARHRATEILLNHVCHFAHEKGHDTLFCMSIRESTDRRYQKLGFRPTATGISTFIKEIKECHQSQ